MSTLTLVRHGQARAFEKDSDRLSDLGARQARLLGEYWKARGVTFTEVYCGTLARQRATAESAGFLDPVADPAWNEYDSSGILKLAPEAAAAFEPHRPSPDANRHFQRMFEAVMTQWVAGELAGPHVESFQAFHARVTRALHTIVDAEPGGRRVLVVTSGGPIGAVVQSVLQGPAAMAIEVNWRIRNCSVTEFLFSRGRIALDSFNGTPHLADPTLITYR